MTDSNDASATDSRRSFVKKGALAAGTLALGATGSAAAQEDGGTPTEDGTQAGGTGLELNALVQTSGFRPRGRFTIVSPVIEWTPEVPNVDDDALASYNTYMIRWLNTDEIVPLWVRDDADLTAFDRGVGYVPAEDDDDVPEIFEMRRVAENEPGSPDLVPVMVSDVPEDVRDALLQTDPWWQEQQGAGGTATATPMEGTGNETGS